MARFNITDEFYEDEIREGFYIPAAIKQAFAVELMVLNEIDRVCSKHGLKYFADWGTFLGAVRHGGFIPWDDDLDICMLRDDYDKFCRVAAYELPEKFAVYNLETNPDHKQFVANVVNSTRICFEKEHLSKYHGFPFIACVDIFVLDYMSADSKKQQLMTIYAKLLLKLSDDICNGKIESSDIRTRLEEIKKATGIEISPDLELNEIRRLLDINAAKLFASFPKEGAKEVVQMMPWGLNSTKIMPACCFTDSVDIPFEMGTIPVPLNYDYILKLHYGDYLKLYKNAGAHGYPYFSTQKREFIEQTGAKFPEFYPNHSDIIYLQEQFKDAEVVNKEEANDKAVNKENADDKAQNKENSEISKAIEIENTEMTYKEVVDACFAEIEEIIKAFSCDLEITDKAVEKFGELQQLFIDLGNYIEAIKGENYDLIKDIENICEIIYLCSCNEKKSDDLVKAFYLLKDKFDKRCEVVFLCVGRKYFDVYKEEYDKLLKDENTDVRVIPLPLYYKNYNGSLRDMKLNFEEFSDIENVCKYDEYKYELIHPKQIYFQFPFDEYNDALSVPPYFYSRRLRKLTDELIYIPYLNPEDFTKENVREYANLKYYACVPGVVYADKVILSTEVMRTSYIAKLAEWLPEVSVKVWRNRITVSKDNIAEPDTDETTGKGRNDPNLKEEDRKKRLLYYVELGYLFRNKAETLCKIRNSIEIILKSEKIALSIAVDEADYEKFRRLMPDEMQEFRAILSGNNIGLIIEKREMYSKLVNDFDAFFGDGGLVAHMFRNAGKPVMLQNYFICGES